MSETNGKSTPKAQALAAIQDARAESLRPEGPRAVVIAALLEDAFNKLQIVEELRIARRAPKRVAQ